jgi:hypothetical protein
MILSYFCSNEGIGAQYQRILGILGICKINNFKYYHKIITVGHNYHNELNWDNKWDDFFNIRNIDLSIKNNTDNLQNIFVPHTMTNLNSLDNNDNIIYNIENPYNIINENPDLYYDSIIDDLRKLYNEKNKDRYFKFFIPNKKNIVIHIRTINDGDTSELPEQLLPGNVRHISDIDYIKIINNLANNTNHIHIFTQSSFNLNRIKTDIENISYHIDTDTFDTFHHFVNADVLIISKSAFSYLAAIYNTNSIIYSPSTIQVPLKHWTNINNLL